MQVARVREEQRAQRAAVEQELQQYDAAVEARLDRDREQVPLSLLVATRTKEIDNQFK